MFSNPASVSSTSGISSAASAALSATHFRYLLAIYELSEQNSCVSSAQIATSLGVSKPSVTRMLGVLMERELITKERYGKVSLTNQGLVAAQRYRNRLRSLTERIPAMGLKLNQEELYQAAGVLAAALPEQCFDI